jgi:hypothetical protein
MDADALQPPPISGQPPPTSTVDPILFDRASSVHIRESVHWTTAQYRLNAQQKREASGGLCWLHNVTAISGATSGTALAAGATGTAVLNDGMTIEVTNTTGFIIAHGSAGIVGWVDGQWEFLVVNNCSNLT